MAPVDVLVRGAGAVGLAGALALARQGFAVALLGSADAPARADVRAYALNAGSVGLLRSLKVWDALPADARCAVYDMRVAGDARGAGLDFSAWAQRSDVLAWIVDAVELESALRTATRFAPHLAWVERPVEARLEVHAEGRDAAARAGLGVQMDLQPYGQRAVAARLVAAQPHAGLARQWFRSPNVLALLPFDRPRAGHGYALVWSLPDASAEAMLALAPADFEAALLDATGGAVGPLALASERAAWPLAHGRASAIAGPGWVLVGDAAHVVHPLAGQGLNLGLANVAALAATLAGREPWRPIGDARLLNRYARARAWPTRAMGHVTDGLLQLFAAPQPFARELRNRGLTLVNHLPPVKRFLTARALDG